MLAVTGTDAAPAKCGIPVADIAAGMYAYSSILAALLERGRTGRGRRIEISMLEALCEWMGYPLYYAFDGASPPPRGGAEHATIFPYGPFAAGDGATVMLGLQNEREWAAFCTDVLRAPELAQDERFATNARRHEARAVLRPLIEAAFAALPAAEVVARLDAAGIAHAQVNTIADVWRHPQLAARGRWTSVDSPAGAIPALLPPGERPGDARMDPIPALGAHTDAILAELGYAVDAIASLRHAGAI